MSESNKQLFDLKFLVTIGAIIATLGGFYFTTSYRIEKLEVKMEKMETLGVSVVRLEEQIKIISKQNDEIYKILINLNRD